MGLGISWTKRGGFRLNISARQGRLREWESIPIGGKTKNGRKRRTRRGISFRL